MRRRRPTRRAAAWTLTLAGLALTAVGAALMHPPSGLIVLGLGVAAAGLLGVDQDDGEGTRRR